MADLDPFSTADDGSKSCCVGRSDLGVRLEPHIEIDVFEVREAPGLRLGHTPAPTPKLSGELLSRHKAYRVLKGRQLCRWYSDEGASVELGCL